MNLATATTATASLLAIALLRQRANSDDRDGGVGNDNHRAALRATTRLQPQRRRLQEPYWYPTTNDSGDRICVHDADYPPSFAESESAILFDTESECCGVLDLGDDCRPVAKPVMWYPVEKNDGSGGVVNVCVHDDTYPASYLGDHVTDIVLFDSREECCHAYIRIGCEDDPNEVSTEFWYPKMVDGIPDCVYGDDYDPTYAQYPTHYFFANVEGCCAAFPVARGNCIAEPVQLQSVAASPEAAGTTDTIAATTTEATTTSEDTTTSEATTTTTEGYAPIGENAEEDFESEFSWALPLDVGSPPQWELSHVEALSGSASIANIPAAGLGATSDLVLKVLIAEVSTLRCMARIDTSSPYETFMLIVDGVQRNTYTQVVDGWIPVVTGISPGDHEVTFRVQNEAWGHNMGDVRLDYFGTGRVYLDDCVVRATRLGYPASDPAPEARAKDNIVATTTIPTTASEATTTTADTNSYDIQEPYWYPTTNDLDVRICAHDADYPPSFAESESAILFDTESECCETFQLEDNCGGGGGDASQPVVKPVMWYPVEKGDGSGGVINLCFHDADYPTSYLEDYIKDTVLFDNRKECCDAYIRIGCEDDPRGDSTEFWYPKLVDGIPDCVYGDDYDPTYAQFPSYYLFADLEGCCAAFPVVGGNCLADQPVSPSPEADATSEATTTTTEATTSTTIVAAMTTTTTEAATTTEVTMDPCTDCMWHEAHDVIGVCTNALGYPEMFEEARPHFFHHTAQDCCDRRFPEGCRIVDVNESATAATPVSASNAPLLGELVEEDFESASWALPLDLSAPQWELSQVEALSGSTSLASVPAMGLGATSDLVLKFSVAEGSTVRCMARIDTSAPYETFKLIVDGVQRNTYSHVVNGWIPVVTGIGPGDHEVTFRVQNEAQGHNMGEVRMEEYYGTGRVYLDDCVVRANRLSY